MSGPTVLIGAEDVARAGGTIADAADTMTRAAIQIDESLHLFSINADRWIGDLASITARLESLMHRAEKLEGKP